LGRHVAHVEKPIPRKLNRTAYVAVRQHIRHQRKNASLLEQINWNAKFDGGARGILRPFPYGQ
jgi:hypothetical protein